MWLVFALFLWPLVLVILISVILLPFHFTIYSLINIVTVPFQLIKIAFNKELRGNHALEHATINVLEEKFGYQGLAGMANENGFIIQGMVDPLHLEMAAAAGLRRLQQREDSLVIHDRCGTSILAANFVTSVIFLLLLLQTGMFNLINVLLAIFLAQIIGPIVGKIIQRYLTTSTQVDDFQIVGVEYKAKVGMGFLGLPISLKPTEFFVRTRRAHHVALDF